MYLSSHLEGREYRNRRLYSDGAVRSRKNSWLVGSEEKSLFDPAAGRSVPGVSKTVEPAEAQIALNSLPIGARLLVRSKKDWRFAAVSKIVEDKVVLTVCSPSGRTYRLRRELDHEIFFEGSLPILKPDYSDTWRENFSLYDHRW